jgi:hypothetical protein
MLVPVAGRYDAAEVNRRRVPPVPKSLREQDPRKFPPVYVFNVGPRRHEFPPLNKGLRVLEACPKGEPYSTPLVFRNIEMEPYDLADGAGNMAWLEEDGIDKAKALIHEGRGGLSIDAEDLTWWGVFVTENEEPTKKELDGARKKVHQMLRLVYDTGSNLKLRGHVFPVNSRDPELYNEAAELLGQSPLFGVAEHTMGKCVFCKEPIIEGALLCRHCGSRQDSKEAGEIKAKSI